jgi:hypothetical protein
MSLAIDVDTVTHVLLSDGWHAVAAGSFTLDSYEFLWSGFDGLKVRELHTRRNEYGGDVDPMILHGGGNHDICAIGFAFTTVDGDTMGGPLSAVLAVRYAGR